MKNMDCLNEFILSCTIRQMSVRTIKGYKNNNLAMFRFIEHEYGITDLEKTTRTSVKGYIQFLTDLGRKETYVNGLIKSFRAYFNYAVEEEYITHSPMDKIKFQREKMPIIQTFTDNEVTDMVNVYRGKTFLEVRNKLIMTILFDTGIRNNELCEFKMTQIRDGSLLIYGKGKKERIVPTSPVLAKMLFKYLSVREFYLKDKKNYQTDFLFLSQKGKQLTISTVENVVAKAGETAKIRDSIRCSPHTCRHYYAQKLYRNNVDIYTISKLLGHSNLQITKRYLQSLSAEIMMAELGIEVSPLTGLMGTQSEKNSMNKKKTSTKKKGV